MMASATGVGYSADIFSGPMVSQKPTSPNLINTIIICILLGCAAGFLLGLYCEMRGQVLTWPWLSWSYAKSAGGKVAGGMHR